MRGAARALGRWAAAHEYAVAALLLLLALSAYFWPLFTGDQMGQSHVLWDIYPWKGERPPGLPPSHNSEGDAAATFHPLLHEARQQLHAGSLPLWNPHSYAGTALLGDMQTALLYPLTWLAFILPLNYAWGVMAALKLFVAGFGAYVFARDLRLAHGPALVAAFVYMLSAPLVVWLQWPLATVFSLLPWLLLATERLYRRPQARTAAALALVVALSLFAGHAETALLSSSAAAIYLLVRALATARSRALGRPALLFMAGHLLGLMASAAALFPFFRQYDGSLTQAVHGEFAEVHLPLTTALLYVLPMLHGDAEPSYAGPLTYTNTAAYFGVVAMLLAAVAAARLRHRPATAGLTAMGAAALMAAFHLPPVGWLLENVPPYDGGLNFRVLYVVALVGALGAGAGYEQLSRRALRPRTTGLLCVGVLGATGVLVALAEVSGRLPAGAEAKANALLWFAGAVGLGALCLLATGRLRAAFALPLVLAAVAVDLSYLQSYNVMLPPDRAYPGATPAISFLQRRSGTSRVSAVRPPQRLQTVFPPNTPALYDLDALQGYDFPQSKRWADFASGALGEVRAGPTGEWTFHALPYPDPPRLAAFRLMNNRYFLLRPVDPLPRSGLDVVYPGPDATILEDPQALPRAYVVGAVRRMEPARALEEFSRGRVEPRQHALIPPDAPATDLSVAGRFRAAQVERLSPDHVRVRVPPGPAGWLVLANTYSRDWDVTVDGGAEKTYPTNFVAMGLPVDAGAHTVEFRFDRSPLWLGVAISAVAIAVMFALLAAPGRSCGGAAVRAHSHPRLRK